MHFHRGLENNINSAFIRLMGQEQSHAHKEKRGDRRPIQPTESKKTNQKEVQKQTTVLNPEKQKQSIQTKEISKPVVSEAVSKPVLEPAKPTPSASNQIIAQFQQSKPVLPIYHPDVYSVPLKKCIPHVYRHGEYKIDNTKCMYFNQGPSKPYTHDLMQLESFSNGKSVWRSMTNDEYSMDSKVDILNALKATPDELYLLNRLGTFVCAQHKWGFVLMLEAIDKLYDGQLDNLLEHCIKIPFFQKLLRKYSYYVMEDKTEINIRDIKSTELDVRMTIEESAQCPVLFSHQLEQVGWMLNLQRNPIFPVSIHTQFIPVFDTGYYINPDHTLPKLLKFSDLPQKAEIKTAGAILASDVGTGKTASMLHLCHLTKKPKEITLIVTPDSILHQWAQEIQKFLPESTYQVVQNLLELQKFNFRQDICFLLVNRKSITQSSVRLLQKQMFKRIIIDEVHEVIKSIQKTKTNIFNKIKTQFVWGVTGTPHHVDYLENLSCVGQLLRFPKNFYEMDNIVDFRRFFINNCIRKNCNVKQLPPLTNDIVYSQLQMIQSLVYRAKLIHSIDEEEARKICFNILPYFQMRQACNDLQQAIKMIEIKLNEEIQKVKQDMMKNENKLNMAKLKTLEGENNFYRDIIGVLMQPTFECVICLDEKPTSGLVVTQCLHHYCYVCYDQFFVHLVHNHCPVCKEVLVKESYLVHPSSGLKKNKIETIMEEIGKTPENEKIIIFTQFHNLVERMAQQFELIKIPYMVLRGQPSEINYRLSIFRKDPSLRILLLSVEQAASGINLTQANHVYFAHPLMGNDYQNIMKTYKQCIGRVQRIGQSRPVHAKLFVGKATIEETFKKYFLN